MPSRIGIDLDGVLFDFIGALERWCDQPTILEEPLRRFERRSAPATRWEFYEDWGWTREHFTAVCDLAVDEGALFMQGDPTTGAVEALQSLLDAGHEVVIVTARNFGKRSEELTRKWLDKHKVPYSELHFAQDKTQFQLDFHLDDSPDVVASFDDTPTTAVVWHQPWNKHLEEHYRVWSFKDFLSFIKVYSRTDSDEVRVVDPDTGGAKGQKLARFDLIPAGPLTHVAEHYGKGAAKYGEDRNWEKGYAWSLSFGALMRHAWAFWNREDIDPDTQSHHMAAVVFHALALMQFGETHPGKDDRP